jgi:outer membrane receptor protein involved in Fe transport
VLGRAYFQNVGATQRQGVDLGLKLAAGRWKLSLNYAYTDATFRTGFVENGGNNPAADINGNITIRPGNHLPGVPAQQIKLGASYQVTDAWTIGTTVTGTSATYLFGDEANLTQKLPGYAVVNLTTSYQLTPRIQFFGAIENVTDQRHYVYGTFSPTSSVYLAQAPNATNPRSYNIAAPIGGYGGMRMTF